MWKKLITFVLLTLFIASIAACGSSDGDRSEALPHGDKKYLAENIIFSDGSSLASKSLIRKAKDLFEFSLISEAYAQSSDIDAETQIYAKNVIFDPAASSQIESDNVQDALEEITLILPSIIVGTWDIQNYHQESRHDSTGRVIVYDDGTFELVEGSFAAIGMGSGTAGDGICSHTEENQTYDTYTEELIAFNHVNKVVYPGGGITYAENTALPRLVKLRQDHIILIGSGGCGEAGRERISILTRIE